MGFFGAKTHSLFLLVWAIYMFSFLSNSINWNGSNCWVWIHLQMGEEGQFGWGNYEPCNFGVPIIWGTPSIEVKTGSSRQCFPWAVRRFMACPVTGICCSWSYPFWMILSDLGLVQHQTLFLCWILESNLLPTVWGLHWLWMNMYFEYLNFPCVFSTYYKLYIYIYIYLFLHIYCTIFLYATPYQTAPRIPAHSQWVSRSFAWAELDRDLSLMHLRIERGDGDAWESLVEWWAPDFGFVWKS